MRWFVLALVVTLLSACGGGDGPAFQPTVSVTVDPAVARVNVDGVTARVTFSPGSAAFGQGSSITWAFVEKPVGSSVSLSPDPNNPQDQTAVRFTPDVSGSYRVQATVNYGAGLPSASSTAVVSAVHAMSFTVLHQSIATGAFTPTEVHFWAVVSSDVPASVEAFFDGQSLGLLTAPNVTKTCEGQHGVTCPSYPAYDYAIPYAQLSGTHTLRWVVTGAPGSGIRGEGTVQVNQGGFISTGPAFNFFGPFSGNP